MNFTNMVLPRGVSIQYNPALDQFELKVPYNPYFNNRLKEITEDQDVHGCYFNSTRKSWCYWPEDHDKVLELVNTFYGGPR